MKDREEADERIVRMRTRYLDDVARISIQRAKYYTESWRETQGSDLPENVRIARAMKRVFERMDITIDADDRIAGSWTEFFLGVPIDVEKGLFNRVFEVELGRWSMIRYLVKQNIIFLAYMLRRYGLKALVGSVTESSRVGAAMPSIGTTPMQKRRVNPCDISRRDKRLLLGKILPYWRGRTIACELGRRIVDEQVFQGDMEMFAAALPATTSRKDIVISLGAAIGIWQGHLILDHVTPIKKGLLAMQEKVREIRDFLTNGDRKARDFLDSVDIALEGVITYARRLAERLSEELARETDPTRRRILSGMLETCKNVPLKPARTFREAVQSYWTVKTAVELAVPFNVHAPGRLDQYFYPYYEADIREGRVTREDARELIEELLLKVMTHNMRPDSNYHGDFGQRYEGSEPVTLGGLTPEGEDAENELTHLILEAAHRSKTALNVVVRLHDETPEDLYLKVADLHYRGTSSISLMNDRVSIEAMKRREFTDTDANDYAITGCVDMCAPGRTGGIGFSALLLARILDITLRNGDSRTLVGTVRNVGLKTGDPDGFKTFDELFSAFIAQTVNMIELIVRATQIRDRLYAEKLPVPYISAFMGGCLEKRQDVTAGGAAYDLEGILFMNSIANVVDSLFVIKKLVYEGKVMTVADILEAVDHNFTGYEDILEKIEGVPGKWGNGEQESDELAHRLTLRLFQETYKHRTFKGGPYAPFINSMTSHTYDGRVSLATPDGRRAAKPYAASCNPYNVDTRGLTGVLRSVASLDFSHVLGCAVNVRLHPSVIGETIETRRKYISLLKTYFRLGGEQVQPTVASTEMLRAAQDDPEQYRGLIVKVGGYSAYFVDLGKEIQNEIISRSEHRM